MFYVNLVYCISLQKGVVILTITLQKQKDWFNLT